MNEKNICTLGIVVTVWVRPAHRSADHFTPPPKYATVSQLKPQLKILISKSCEHTSDWRREETRKRNKAKHFTFLLGGSYKKKKKNTVAWGKGRGFVEPQELLSFCSLLQPLAQFSDPAPSRP